MDDDTPITVAISPVLAPITVIVSQPAPVAVAVPPVEDAVTVVVQASPPGPEGPPGAAVEVVVMDNLAAYLALAPEVQMDGRWYVIPK